LGKADDDSVDIRHSHPFFPSLRLNS
jgi:hypothetical protein